MPKKKKNDKKQITATPQPKIDYEKIAENITNLSDFACALTGPGGNYAEAYKHFQSMVSIIDDGGTDLNEALANLPIVKANALSNMGLCCSELNKLELSKTHLEESLKLNPNDVEAQGRMARTYALLNMGVEANVILEKLCKNPTALNKKQLGEAYSLYVQNAINSNLIYDEKILTLRYQLALRYEQHDLKLVYENYIAEKQYENKEFDEALAFFSPLLNSQNIESQVSGLYYCGLIFRNKEYTSHDALKASKYFQGVVRLYQDNPEKFTGKSLRLKTARAMHGLAKFFDEDSDTLVPDPDEALKYYRMAADLNYPLALHDLGYKYEYGEDVEANLATAISYYKKAAHLKYPDAMLNLGVLLAFQKDSEEHEEGIKWLKLATNYKLTEIRAYRSLGTHYREAYNDSDRTDPTLAKTAFEYYRTGEKLGDYEALYNLGQAYYFGVGVEASESLAIEYLRKATEGNLTNAYVTLIDIYMNKLRDENSEPEYDQYLKILSELMTKSGLYPNLKVINFDTRELFLAEFKLRKKRMKEKFIGINKDITATADNIKLKAIARIKTLLEKDITTMNPVNICTLVNRVGALTIKTLDKRKFHAENLPKIIELVNQVLMHFNKNHFDPHQITGLIEGFSKLQLKANVTHYAETIEKLFAYASQQKENFKPWQLVNVIYSASRLDPSLAIFNEILLSLINYTLQYADQLDTHANANLLYSQAILNALFPTVAELPGFKQVLDNAIKTIASNTPQPIQFDEKKASETNASDFQNSLHQIYTSLFYFSKKYPHFATETDLKKYIFKIDTSRMAQHISKLQEGVVDCLEQYTTDSESEKDINTLPVDAYVQMDANNKFILQVDGPSHFLHGEDKSPIVTLKTHYRDAFLTLSSGCPVVSVPYYEWNEKKNPEAKFSYLQERILNKTGITLQQEKWEKVTPQKSLKSHSIFKSEDEKYNKSFNLLANPRQEPKSNSRAKPSLNLDSSLNSDPHSSSNSNSKSRFDRK